MCADLSLPAQMQGLGTSWVLKRDFAAGGNV